MRAGSAGGMRRPAKRAYAGEMEYDIVIDAACPAAKFSPNRDTLKGARRHAGSLL
jgi:hypothetical protein